MTVATFWFKPGHGDHPPTASTDDELNAVLDEVLSEANNLTVANILIVDEHGRDCFMELGGAAKEHLGAIRYANPDGCWYTKGDPSGVEQVYFYYYGNERQYPGDSPIPLDAARRAVAEFLTTDGQRPTCVQWQAVEIPGIESGST